MYRRAHYRANVANIAHVRLITKLKDQSVFTQTAYVGTEKGGGSVTLEGLDGRDTLGLVWS